MPARPIAIVILAAFAAACGDAPQHGARSSAAPLPAPDPGVYRGLFPCEDCPGIDTTLWLRADGVFFWRQQYLDEPGTPALTTRSFGRWRLDADGTLVLDGSGPARRLELAGADELLLITLSELEHRLSYAPDAPPFADRIPIAGLMTVDGSAVALEECRTGLAAPAAGDLRQFLRQYRSLGYRGKPAFVEVEARFEWSDDGELRAFAVERFVRIKTNAECQARLG